MEEKETGISTAFILFVVFLVLKLCKVINWNWWWVTSPLWITVGIAIIVGIIVSSYVVTKRLKHSKKKKDKGE